jgi:hypothetical protein
MDWTGTRARVAPRLFDEPQMQTTKRPRPEPIGPPTTRPLEPADVLSAMRWARGLLAAVRTYLVDVSTGIADSWFCERPKPAEDGAGTDWSAWERYAELLLQSYAEADANLEAAGKAERPACLARVLRVADRACVRRGDAPITFNKRVFRTATGAALAVHGLVRVRRPQWDGTDSPTNGYPSALEVQGSQYLDQLASLGASLIDVDLMMMRTESEAIAVLETLAGRQLVPKERGVYGRILRVLRERGPTHTDVLIDAVGGSNIKPVLAALVDMELLHNDRRRGYSIPVLPDVPRLDEL